MEACVFCEDMPAGYTCVICGREGKEETDFKYQWYAFSVRIHATEPVVRYRHGPRKGEPKGVAWNKCLLDSPTQYMYYGVQGIRDEKHCEAIIRDSYRLMVAEFESLGYTDVTVSVSVAGTYFN